MEEIRKTASAYYGNCSEDQKKLVKSLFDKMVSKKDGGVTLSEYENNFEKLGLSCDIPKKSSLFDEIFKEKKTSFFNQLDKNGDGVLDFEEFITLFYLLSSGRLLFCKGNGCQVFLDEVFFSCPKCFKKPKKIITLCPNCYTNNNYSHKHPLVDNYAFLMTTQGPTSKVKTAIHIAHGGLFAFHAIHLCTIM
ncbi:uncharacterized protein LOC133816623 [Humulus lupulus]|uniref:uncharacterized protein LOC133816623 n=1 Tax=Humulus lupulus TaxID=3486 RepID=UPI002B415D2C|nr:uncharacterized protein LOC133816623 [Humulus lupulus]